jgi:hypothetical protein
MSQVEPVLPPALAVTRAGQQSIDHALERVGPAVGEEGIDFLWGRGKAGEVKSNTADQGCALGLGRMRNAQLFELGQDEPVDRVAHPARLFDRRRFDPLHRLKSPVAALLARECFGWRITVRPGCLISGQDARGYEKKRSQSEGDELTSGQWHGGLFHGEARAANSPRGRAATAFVASSHHCPVIDRCGQGIERHHSG